MRYRRLQLLSFILLCCILNLQHIGAQVLNIEKVRKVTDTTGFAGAVGIEGSYFKNVNVIYSLKLSSDIQYKTQKDLFILYGEYQILESNETEFLEESLLHFRYNRKLSPLLRWEAFTQVQKNKINKIKLRWLLGMGPRLKLLENSYLKVYLGIIPMYEYEVLESSQDKYKHDLRLSNYLSFTLELNEVLSWVATTYYQVLPYGWSDFRIYCDSAIKAAINRHLDMTFTVLYGWDARPVEGVPQERINSTVGLKYKF